MQDNYADNNEFIKYIEDEFGVGRVLDLHKSMTGKYGTPKFGTGRATYLSKYCVFKVPVSVDGFRLNDLEGSTISIGEPNKIGYIPIARSRLILIKDVPIVAMEKVIEADINDIKDKIGKVPDFVSSVDMGQVGFNKKGNLVAFDYADQ